MTLTTVTTVPSLRSLLLTALCTSPLFSYVNAHMAMSSPSPWDDPSSANAADRDYDIKSPLKPDGSDFPCKGLEQAQGSLTAAATYKAGQNYNTTIAGTANHSGGSCQLSLSYDQGKTWKVIKSMIGGCPAQGTNSYQFTIPMTAPSGTALFAWTWINHTGNREFYMNCAVVDIEGQDGGSLCMLPNLYVANLKGINSCVSPEGSDTMYAHPGSDVVYGDGMSSSSPVTGSDKCEIPAPVCSNSGSSDSSQSKAPSSARTASGRTNTASASRDGAGAQGSGIAQVEIAANTAGAGFTSAVESYIASILGESAASATGAEGAALTSLIGSYISSVLEETEVPTEPTPAIFPTDVGSTVTPIETAPPSITTTFFGTSTVTSTGTVTSNATAVSLINSYIQSVLSATPQPSVDSSNGTVSSNWTAAPSIPPFLLNIFGEATAQRLDSLSVSGSTSCPPRPVVTAVTTAPLPAATCVAPVVACDCVAGDYCRPVNDCTTRCAGAGIMSASSSWATVVVSSGIDTTGSRTSTPSLSSPIIPPSSSLPPPSSLSRTGTLVPSSLSPPNPTGSTSPHPPYIATDPNTALYLPCTPGNFLCHSPTSFYTCDQPAPANLSALATTGWAWGWERPVAPGMMCLPFERASNSTESAARGPSVRDDRYVRARPHGDCATDGSLQCVEGGKAFWVCDQDGWVDMGAVAEGTWCVGGGIVRTG